VRAISIRIATAFLAIFAAGLIITPVETSARSGGFAGSHAIPSHAGFPGRMVRPGLGRGFPARTARPGFAGIHGLRHFRHRRFVGAGAPWGAWGYAPSDLGYYEPPAVAPEEQPSDEPIPMQAPPRRGCSTQIYKVPSESGGEVSVKVVRC
jgi:hypothetical protein